MARPSKSIDTISKNLTKEEIEQRKQAENAALSGIEIREFEEVANDEVSHKEFERVIELLNAVGKNDAMFEATINDYCMFKSDIDRYRKYESDAEHDLENVMLDEDMDVAEKYALKSKIRNEIYNHDRQINNLQKKRFDIEKENGFTVSSALRNIPKKVEEKANPLALALGK